MERGDQNGGFVVQALEGHEAFVVRADGAVPDRPGEEQRYRHALGAAGFGVVTGVDDKGGLWVWPAGVRPVVPRPSPRELAEDWLRTLTISGEPGITPTRAVELMHQVNQPRKLGVRMRTPLPLEDVQVLEDTLAWHAEVRSRQIGLNLLVEDLLIGWLADATGQDRPAIVQRLALEIENMLPPGNGYLAPKHPG
ncbi:hypothetical protein [Frankia canadensis]|uniref:hypothetical protein n=1 Tax=Frankia canadensis TaxID=1836972 RepID=UPI000C7C420D|nr:hypothetical protein [Frankia canadensis]